MICVCSGISSSRSRKCSTGSSSAMSGRSSSVGGDLGQLAVLGRELGRGRDLDALGLPQAALGEGREPAQRLDLDVEHVDADGALLRRRVDVEQAAADRELAAVLDLVDALVAGGDELLRGLVEIEQLADAEHEAVRAQLRVRHLLRQRGRGDDDDRLLGAVGRVGERVERGHAQADEVRRRASGGTRRRRRGSGSSGPGAGCSQARRSAARSRAARSSPTTISAGRLASWSASAATTNGRSDWLTNADPPSLASWTAAGS